MKALPTITRAGVFFVAGTIWTSPAIAEVCDKQRPDWDPASGPVGQLGEAVSAFSSLIWLFVLFVVFVNIYWGKRWLFAATSAFSLTVAGLYLIEWIISDRVFVAALREGCRAVPIVSIGLMLLLSAWLARRAWKL